MHHVTAVEPMSFMMLLAFLFVSLDAIQVAWISNFFVYSFDLQICGLRKL